MKRCTWVNEKNPLYVKYHDEEWGTPVYDDRKLFEMLLLESFEAGHYLGILLNKIVSFKKYLYKFYYKKINVSFNLVNDAFSYRFQLIPEELYT